MRMPARATRKRGTWVYNLHTETFEPLLPFPTKHYDHGHRPAEYVAPVTTTLTHHTPDVIMWVGSVRAKTGAVNWVGVVTLDTRHHTTDRLTKSE